MHPTCVAWSWSKGINFLWAMARTTGWFTFANVAYVIFIIAPNRHPVLLGLVTSCNIYGQWNISIFRKATKIVKNGL